MLGSYITSLLLFCFARGGHTAQGILDEDGGLWSNVVLGWAGLGVSEISGDTHR